jgi:diadenosine tetraphosphatase ApaH/serine/threonine PP2A family protein phosphatase
MRAAVLADVHANLVSLEAVLTDAAKRGRIDQLWVLGDLVGYGPRPNECVERLRQHSVKAVAGNHDRAATGGIGTGEFNPHAAAAAKWTAAALSPPTIAYLDGLPETIHNDPFMLVHGTLRDPIWEYLYTPVIALAHMRLQRTNYSLVGHTHMPMVVTEEEEEGQIEMRRLGDGETVALGDTRLVLNPGSSGQPRDGDPRACYAILDTDEHTFSHFRVEYDIKATQRQMKEVGLPPYLIERLTAGR